MKNLYSTLTIPSIMDKEDVGVNNFTHNNTYPSPSCSPSVSSLSIDYYGNTGPETVWTLLNIFAIRLRHLFFKSHSQFLFVLWSWLQKKNIWWLFHLPHFDKILLPPKYILSGIQPPIFNYGGMVY